VRPRPETWNELWEAAPSSLRRYLLDFEWDRHRLWELPLQEESMPVLNLAWQLQLPWWRMQGRPFAITPHQVAASPHRHLKHYSRTLNADLHKCLHVTYRAERWVVLDGIHRLLKAWRLGLHEVRVGKVERWSYEAIRVNPLENSVYTVPGRFHGPVRRVSQPSSEAATCS
jgi:hypothetical protein